jgi:hypothetical protein
MQHQFQEFGYYWFIIVLLYYMYSISFYVISDEKQVDSAARKIGQDMK